MTTNHDLQTWLPKLSTAAIVCVGDVMLDRYVYGDVERVSPEAPIPVLSVKRHARAVGGAGNVACNIAAVGGAVQLIAVVGDDASGADVRALLGAAREITAHLLVDRDRPTTVKTRFIAGSQQLLRADEERTGALGEALRGDIIAAATAAVAAPGVGALILSDYGKGVLDPAVIAAVIAAARAAGVPVVVDPKGSNYAKYAGADILTPNRKELSEATRQPTATTDDIVAAATQLREDCRVGAVLVTRGGEGMSLITADAAPVHLPALAREVFDVSGAGDTVVAVLASGLAAGLDAAEAAQLANIAAGLVVAKVGTAVVRVAELAGAIDAAVRVSDKIVDLAQLTDQVAQWRARGLTVGFTNGCFDLVHPGHISLIEQAEASCDRLIVALNSDASVRRLKGASRPVQDAAARSRVLASLGAVDAVVVFEDDTPIELIRAVRPDVLVKGADYALDEVVGGEFVHSYGGRVVLAELVEGVSTTATIARLGAARPR